MAILDHFIQGEDDPGFDARWMFYGQAESLGDAIGSFEPNAINVTFELIRIFLDCLESGIPIRLVYFDRQVGADTVTVQKHHDFLDLFFLFPGGGNFLYTILAYARHLKQAFRTQFDNIECIFFEPPYNTLGQPRTDSLDHARTKITLDPSDSGRQGLFANFCFELCTMFWMIIPVPLQAQMLPWRELRQIADDCSQALRIQGRFISEAMTRVRVRAQA